MLANVKAVIVDSPFASPETVAHTIIVSKFPSCFHRLVKYSLDTTPLKWMTKKALARYYPAYDSTGITPIKAVKQLWEKVDKNMVIVFIHSQQDTLISVNDSRMLYSELKKLGFNNLYFIETTQGKHGQSYWESDHDAVLRALILIYLKHDLPLPKNAYNKAVTALLQEYRISKDREKIFSELTIVQPSADDVYERIYPDYYISG